MRKATVASEALPSAYAPSAFAPAASRADDVAARKSVAPSAAPKPPRSSKPLIAVLVALVVVATGGLGYLYVWEQRRDSGSGDPISIAVTATAVDLGPAPTASVSAVPTVAPRLWGPKPKPKIDDPYAE